MLISVERYIGIFGGGGGGSEHWGAKGWGGKHFVGCKLIRAPAPNQCLIITILTLKTDDIANLRIEKNTFRNSNTIKGTYIKLVYL